MILNYNIKIMIKNYDTRDCIESIISNYDIGIMIL